MIDFEKHNDFTSKLIKSKTIKNKISKKLADDVSNSKSTEIQNTNSILTPNLILADLISEFYSIDPSDSLYEFSEELTRRLASLSTGGSETDIFGKDLNDLFQSFVMSLNMLGKMKKLLDDNGIDFDLSSGTID